MKHRYTALCPTCFIRFEWVKDKGLKKHKCLSDGPDIDSTGQQVTEWTAR